jgi:putative two-component system response regulator
MLHTEVINQNALLEEKINERTKELYNSQIDLIQRLAKAIECRDMETGSHINRMSHYAFVLAKLYGLSESRCELILRTAPLHDIGKIGIPDSILQKPGKLTPEEWETMKTHTILGANLLSGNQSEFMIAASEIALTHHEHWDGRGYPQGLSGEIIPIFGRICCLSDNFDALTSERPYKEAWSVERAIAEIRSQSKLIFDPDLVTCFCDNLDDFKSIQLRYQDCEHLKNTNIH